MTLHFYKYQGTGNDFVICDNRDGNIFLSQDDVEFLCDRRFGIGADGLMLLNSIKGYDFGMQYYNADGRESSMCGNGGRCLTRFAWDRGMHLDRFQFLAVDGPHTATMGERDWVNLKMQDVNSLEPYPGGFILNTGSPHYVRIIPDVMGLDVRKEGREIRYSKDFEAEGINVNFAESVDRKILVRTYERGVEDETYSCGTGVTASALLFPHNESGFNHIDVQTRGGMLAVEFDKKGEQHFENIWLCGPATFVFEGDIILPEKE
jgi:diaminopimelate epimerase